MGVFHSAVISLGIWGSAVSAAYLLARTIFKAQVSKRRNTLRSLVDELADQSRDLMRVLPRRT
jgi:CHASE1-domain containing sensor protein